MNRHCLTFLTDKYLQGKCSIHKEVVIPYSSIFVTNTHQYVQFKVTYVLGKNSVSGFLLCAFAFCKTDGSTSYLQICRYTQCNI